MPAPVSTVQRHALLTAVQALTETGMDVRQACIRVGVKVASYYRWLTQPAPKAASPDTRRGRPQLLDLAPEQIARLRYFRLVHDSAPEAIQSFLADPLCDPATAHKIRTIWNRAIAEHKRPSWPLSIRRACHVTAAEQNEFRGEKHARDTTVTERRGAFWINEDGLELPLLPNTIWESDDMSVNEPFRFFDVASGRERLGRQTLQTIDVMSYKMLGVTHIGRERDAYRVEDIADHALDLITEFGLPTLWRIERGVWDNSFFFGINLPDGKTWGGIDTLIHIRQKFSSRGKANIEGSFNRQQTKTAHGPEGNWYSIGRSRGEFEEATKLYLKAQQTADERTLAKFAHVTDHADWTASQLADLNARPVQRSIYGGKFLVPNDLYQPTARRDCPPTELWRFLPVKQQATIRNGAIQIKVNHYPVPFRFRLHGAADFSHTHFDNGFKVLIAFHPGNPAAGCHIFNGDTSTKNRDAIPFAQRLGLAEWLPAVAQESLAGYGDSAFANRKAERAGVRREYRSLTATRTRKTYAQDGVGNALAARTGAPSTTTRDTPAPRPRHTPAHFAEDRLADDNDALEAAERHLRTGNLIFS
jgi:hypothetical protein